MLLAVLRTLRERLAERLDPQTLEEIAGSTWHQLAPSELDAVQGQCMDTLISTRRIHDYRVGHPT